MQALRVERLLRDGSELTIQHRNIRRVTGGRKSRIGAAAGTRRGPLHVREIGRDGVRGSDVVGLRFTDINWQDATPEIQWKVDRQKALQLGINFSDVANTLNQATNGTIATSYYQENGFQYPIIVQVPRGCRSER